MKCCFCKKECGEFGNNPAPINNSRKARCCDLCNWTIVMVARLGNTKQAQEMFTEETYKEHLEMIEKLKSKGANG